MSGELNEPIFELADLINKTINDFRFSELKTNEQLNEKALLMVLFVRTSDGKYLETKTAKEDI